MADILIRFDDVCPTMNYSQWNIAKQLMAKYEICPLIGVIPNCRDKDLLIEEPHSDFWKEIRELQKKGHTIAMHGYEHVFDIQSRGLTNGYAPSEFAGHTYEDQLNKISNGKKILNAHGIETDIFFAPAHSYDMNTIRALSANGFKYMIDGKSFKPINRLGVVCVPCLTSGVPTIRRKGHYMIVQHTHTWADEKFKYNYLRLLEVCKNRRSEIRTFEEYIQIGTCNLIGQEIIEKMYIIYSRYLREKMRFIRSFFKKF